MTMDGDLQHPPAVVREMYAAWKSGYKIVETRRIDPADISWVKKSTSRAFYWVFSRLSGFPMLPERLTSASWMQPSWRYSRKCAIHVYLSEVFPIGSDFPE